MLFSDQEVGKKTALVFLCVKNNLMCLVIVKFTVKSLMSHIGNLAIK
jgi:hypothetical protein